MGPGRRPYETPWKTSRREPLTPYGAARIDAVIDADNVQSIAFWESLGFELDSHGRRWSLLL